MVKHILNPKLITSFVALLLLSQSVYAEKKLNLYTVKSSPVSQVLYYSGSLMPIGNQPVISPTEGVVVQKLFKYGISVNKGDKLLKVRATKLIDKVRDAEATYLTSLTALNKLKTWSSSSDMINAREALLKAQRTLTQQKQTYLLNQHLLKLGIMSKDDVTASYGNYQDGKAALNQAERSLKEAKDKGTGDNYTIAKLKYSTAKENYFSLKKQLVHNVVVAPSSGIILQPKSGSNGGASGDSSGGAKSSSTGPIDIGSEVTYQQVLMIVGNLSGVSVKFSVPEVNINQIHKGLKATITGAGFKGVVLHGVINSVSAQADSGQDGSVATFPAVASVDKVTPAAAKLIRSGMNAQVAITVYRNPHALSVPVKAVFNQAGKSYVKRYSASAKKSTNAVVQTGKVSVNNVEILQGVKSGDQIVVPAN